MVVKSVLFTGLIVGVLLLSCNKNKGEDRLEELNVDNSEIEPVATEEEDAIFDEFYEESEPVKEEKEETRPVDKKASEAIATPSFDPEGHFVVQVSCVKSKNYAKKIAIKLEDQGFPSYIAEVENPVPHLSGLFYRIRIGSFSTLRIAKEFCENNLVIAGYEYWIDNRSNDNIGFSGLGLGTSNNASLEYEASTTEAKPYSPEPPIEKETETAPTSFEDQTRSQTVKTPQLENADNNTAQPQNQTQPPALSNTSTNNPVPTPSAPIVQEPSQSVTKTSQTIKTETPSNEDDADDDNWGELDEEWGSDTSDW